MFRAPFTLIPSLLTAYKAAGYTAAFVATCCRLMTEHQNHAHGHGFVGLPHYFGDNTDSATRKKNQAEFKQRKEAAHCFKRSIGDVTVVPFLD